jgi:hypothetical protein
VLYPLDQSVCEVHHDHAVAGETNDDPSGAARDPGPEKPSQVFRCCGPVTGIQRPSVCAVDPLSEGVMGFSSGPTVVVRVSAVIRRSGSTAGWPRCAESGLVGCHCTGFADGPMRQVATGQGGGVPRLCAMQRGRMVSSQPGAAELLLSGGVGPHPWLVEACGPGG